MSGARPDSDSRKAPRRFYEIAGAPHGPSFITNYQPRTADVVKSGTPEWPTDVYTYGCVEPYANQFPRQYIEPAMYVNMERWVSKGTPPPHAAPIRVTGGGTPQVAFVTDEFGNVKGGVRSPYLDVPVATYSSTATAKAGVPYCSSFGHQVPFGTDQLGQFYGTPLAKQNYVAEVGESTRQMLRGRWVLPEDAQKIVQEAELRPIPWALLNRACGVGVRAPGADSHPTRLSFSDGNELPDDTRVDQSRPHVSSRDAYGSSAVTLPPWPSVSRDTRPPSGRSRRVHINTGGREHRRGVEARHAPSGERLPAVKGVQSLSVDFSHSSVVTR